eukprot:TRINITY_DN136264_c0_g1_i1.p1 TRINITY_DN136264_c0_g1~~TRINITY_DN136264_c0_g1_i1.p1  ORF type:complete len:134 (-),score=19.86 TRINITY_DN136264_c0_g1_i1:128-529(-)
MNYDPFESSFFKKFKEGVNNIISLSDTDIIESGNNLIVRTDIPGVNPEDVHVEIKKNHLYIEYEKPCEIYGEDDPRKVLFSARDCGSYEKVISLPKLVEEESATASMKNGVLSVNIEKAKKEDKKSIKINVHH